MAAVQWRRFNGGGSMAVVQWRWFKGDRRLTGLDELALLLSACTCDLPVLVCRLLQLLEEDCIAPHLQWTLGSGRDSTGLRAAHLLDGLRQ